MRHASSTRPGSLAVLIMATACGAPPPPGTPEPGAGASPVTPPREAGAANGVSVAANGDAGAESSGATSGTDASVPLQVGQANDAGVDGATTRAPHAYRRVLSVGDSFNGAFGLALAKLFEAEGVRFARDAWVGVSVLRFAQSDYLPKHIRAHDPDLVLINLGANDLDAGSLRPYEAAIRRIVAMVGARRCIWILPALWKPDTGVMGEIERHASPCTVYPSRGYKVPRARDGYHPSIAGGRVWAERFWEFFRSTQ